VAASESNQRARVSTQKQAGCSLIDGRLVNRRALTVSNEEALRETRDIIGDDKEEARARRIDRRRGRAHDVERLAVGRDGLGEINKA
jgi:hypothetical protein